MKGPSRSIACEARPLEEWSERIGQTLYPREIAPILTVRDDDDDEEEDNDDDAPRTMKVDLLSGDAAAAQSDEKQTGGKAGDGAAEEEEKNVLAELAKWGVGSDLQREIAKAVTDNGDDVGMMCGDAMAIEHRGGAAAGVGSSHNVRSSMGFASSGIDELKHAQFRAALSNVEEKKEDGVKPQAKPSNSRDPMRWFALLPPPSLRQAQKNFRSATELMVRCANAQARMEVEKRKYEALMPKSKSKAAPPLSPPPSPPQPSSDASSLPALLASLNLTSREDELCSLLRDKGRPALLAELKGCGVAKLADRQKLASAFASAIARRSCLRGRQTHQSPSTRSLTIRAIVNGLRQEVEVRGAIRL